MNPVLTNEQITMTQVCVRCWRAYLDALAHTSIELANASSALDSFAQMPEDERSRDLTRLGDPYEGTITIDDVEWIVWTINNVIQYHFSMDCPQHLRRVWDVWFELLCHHTDRHLREDLSFDSNEAIRLLTSERKRWRVPSTSHQSSLSIELITKGAPGEARERQRAAKTKKG